MTLASKYTQLVAQMLDIAEDHYYAGSLGAAVTLLRGGVAIATTKKLTTIFFIIPSVYELLTLTLSLNPHP